VVLALSRDRSSFQFNGGDYGKFSTPILIRSSSSISFEVFGLLTCEVLLSKVPLEVLQPINMNEAKMFD